MRVTVISNPVITITTLTPLCNGFYLSSLYQRSELSAPTAANLDGASLGLLAVFDELRYPGLDCEPNRNPTNSANLAQDLSGNGADRLLADRHGVFHDLHLLLDVFAAVEHGATL